MLNILRDFDFPKVKRYNVRETDDDAYGVCLGHIFPWGGALKYNGNERFTPKLCCRLKQERYKVLFEECIKYMKEYDSDFKFTSIMLNKNIKCKKHIDKYNHNLSYIIGLGHYEGGELLLYDKKGNITDSINIKDTFYKFDGHTHHSTNDFTGERYSLVFYSICDYNEENKQYFL